MIKVEACIYRERIIAGWDGTGKVESCTDWIKLWSKPLLISKRYCLQLDSNSSQLNIFINKYKHFYPFNKSPVATEQRPRYQQQQSQLIVYRLIDDYYTLFWNAFFSQKYILLFHHLLSSVKIHKTLFLKIWIVLLTMKISKSRAWRLYTGPYLFAEQNISDIKQTTESMQTELNKQQRGSWETQNKQQREADRRQTDNREEADRWKKNRDEADRSKRKQRGSGQLQNKTERKLTDAKENREEADRWKRKADRCKRKQRGSW